MFEKMKAEIARRKENARCVDGQKTHDFTTAKGPCRFCGKTLRQMVR
jgi:hypothetical protein